MAKEVKAFQMRGEHAPDPMEDPRMHDQEEASDFFCAVYRLLERGQTEEVDVRALLSNPSKICRCAGAVYARYAVPAERLWELLGDLILDSTSLGAGEAGRNQSVGEFAQSLLTDEKYRGQLPMPRLSLAHMRKLRDRLAPVGQLRRRQAQNLKVWKERYKEAGLPVEVCRDEDGEWQEAQTAGPPDTSLPWRVTVPVVFSGGGRAQVSLEGLISPRGGADARSSRHRDDDTDDLTRSRGRSHRELREEAREAERNKAVVAEGNQYWFGAKQRCPMRFRSAEGRRTVVETGIGQELERQMQRRLEQEKEVENRADTVADRYLRHGDASSWTRGSDTDIERPDTLRLG